MKQIRKMRQNFVKNGKKRRKWIGLFFVLPWIIGFVVFSAYPLLSAVMYSFTNFQMGSTPKFTGLYNYIRMFTRDVDFYHSLGVTLNYAIVSIVLKLLVALGIAMLLNLKLPFKGFYRAVFYLPSIFGGSVAISMLWRMMFGYSGLINSILGIFGVEPIPWLTDTGYALYTVSFVNVWMFGSSMVLFLAALKDVPTHLYEAAKIDGANSVKCFFHITLPMISPIFLFNLVMQTINAFQEFTGAFTIPTTPGGPMKSTYLFSIKIYQHAFGNYEMGYACALSMVLFLIIFLFTLVIQMSSKKWVFYADE